MQLKYGDQLQHKFDIQKLSEKRGKAKYACFAVDKEGNLIGNHGYWLSLNKADNNRHLAIGYGEDSSK